MRSKRRATLAISLCAVILMAVILPAVALASSYYSSLHVGPGQTYTGPARFYNGKNMHITTNSHSDGTGNYKVILIRNRTWPIPDDDVGYVLVPRNGSGRGDWSNVGSANYKFKFDNRTSNYDVYCGKNQVHMWSN